MCDFGWRWNISFLVILQMCMCRGVNGAMWQRYRGCCYGMQKEFGFPSQRLEGCMVSIWEKRIVFAIGERAAASPDITPLKPYLSRSGIYAGLSKVCVFRGSGKVRGGHSVRQRTERGTGYKDYLVASPLIRLVHPLEHLATTRSLANPLGRLNHWPHARSTTRSASRA